MDPRARSHVNWPARTQGGLATDSDSERCLVPKGWANRHKALEIVSIFLREVNDSFGD